MKYFTLASLTVLAATAHASSSAAPTVPKTVDSSSAPVVPEQQSTAASSFMASVFQPLINYGREVVETVTDYANGAKNVIEAQLEKPSTLSPSTLVNIQPTDNCCVAQNKSQFWTNLYKTTDPVLIKKMIFCPNAIVYLKDLNPAKLISSVSGDQLQYILTALMLRRETLIDKYSDSFVDAKFMDCFTALWNKVHTTDPAQMEYWPCDSKSCSPSTIKSSFVDFTNANDSCRIILKDQLAAYAQKVADASVTQKLTTSAAVRDAIRINLNQSPHLTLPFSTLFDTVAETNNQAAAAKIQEALQDVKNVLATQTEGKSTVYSDAEKCFISALAKPPTVTIETPVTKTESA